MSVANPNPSSSQAVPMSAPASGGGTLVARGIGLFWALLMWGLAGGVALCILIGVAVLVGMAKVSVEIVAATILWMKFSVVIALYWCTAFRCFGNGGMAMALSSARGAAATELRMHAKDKFSRAASLLGDMNLAMLFETFIVFFTLLAWAIFAYHAAALVLAILALPVAAGHWVLTVVIQDKMGDRVERA